ncbi:MAG TPA: hypothetical protein DCK99_02765 [Blastocatellia bacterium]|nr:hypothetical protein [Blastocatellia bacterium]
MPRSSGYKSSRNSNPGKEAAQKGRYKNQDKHRWRKVAVWLIPLIFVIPFTIAFSAHGRWFVWSVLSSALVLFGYAVFLMEWYVWREGRARELPLLSFSVLCVTAFGVGLIWQHRLANGGTESASSGLASAPSKAKANEERVLLDVKPEYLADFFTKYNDAQAHKLVETYIGKWVKVSGEVIDVSRYSGGPNATVNIRTAPRSRLGFIADFEEQRWVDRVLVLRRDEPITVFGQITKITALGPEYVTFWLGKCEVVE